MNFKRGKVYYAKEEECESVGGLVKILLEKGENKNGGTVVSSINVYLYFSFNRQIIKKKASTWNWYFDIRPYVEADKCFLYKLFTQFWAETCKLRAFGIWHWAHTNAKLHMPMAHSMDISFYTDSHTTACTDTLIGWLVGLLACWVALCATSDEHMNCMRVSIVWVLQLSD